MKRTVVNPIIKDTATFLQTAEETGGKLTEIEVTLMPKGGNALHYHKTYSETFTALEGDLGIKLAKGKSVILKPGDRYTVKPMELHGFFNPTEMEIKFNVKLNPGHTGFETSIRILYGLAGDGLTNKSTIPKSIKHTAIIACMSDMNAPGALSLLFPLLRYYARKAKENGEEQRLIDKYCY